jgi:hypothetical protein
MKPCAKDFARLALAEAATPGDIDREKPPARDDDSLLARKTP